MKKLFFCISMLAFHFSINAQNWVSKPTKTVTTLPVVIGAYNPSAGSPLTVVNNDTTYGGSTTIGTFQRLGSSAVSGKLKINVTDFDDNYGDVCIDAQDSADLVFRTKGGAGGILIIKKKGNVGVGVLSPSAKFHVNGTMRFQGIGEGTNKVLTSDANGFATWQNSIWTKSNNDIYYSSGKIGIGTVTPLTSLHVTDAQAQITLSSTGDYTTNYSAIKFEGGANSYYIGKIYSTLCAQCPSSEQFVIQKSNGVSRIAFTTANDIIVGNTNFSSNGDVTIGYRAYQKLMINGGLSLFGQNNATIDFYSLNALNPVWEQVYHSANSSIASVLKVYKESGGIALTFDDRTSGSTIQKFKIAGNGVVYATEITVREQPFPDYVFDKNYSLMPLKELDNYISVNKHLPKIPTAKEIEEQGAKVGEIQALQMEKIEELTLYIIQQQKLIEEMNQRIKQLEAK
ncbi:MAG: hypothetical protein ACKOXB_00985 [Flavobacteriales bacterium]